MYKRWFVGSLIVTATLLTPALSYAAVAAAPQAKVALQVRIYDRNHKDSHVWDAQEDKTYRVYLVDHHMKYRRYSALSTRQQTNYWNWRHANPRQGER